MAENNETKTESAVARRMSGLKAFFTEVQVEMKKCTWPSWLELREQTGVVVVSVLLLAVVVMVSDGILMSVTRLLFH